MSREECIVNEYLTYLSLGVINAVLLTAIIVPVVLWRYRLAVLAGMKEVSGPPLLLPVVQPLRERVVSQVSVAAALCWERRLRRRLLLLLLLAGAAPALLLALNHLVLSRSSLTPALVFIRAAGLVTIAVPVSALIAAASRPRLLAQWVQVLMAMAVASIAVSVFEQIALGRAPDAEQLHAGLAAIKVAALSALMPALPALVIGARAVRGVAPMAFSALLMFAPASVLHIRLTEVHVLMPPDAWLVSWTVVDTGFVLLALPAGLAAAWRLRRISHAHESGRLSDTLLLARSWWWLLVVFEALRLVDIYKEPLQLAGTLVVLGAAYLLATASIGPAVQRAFAGELRPTPRRLLLLRVFGYRSRTEALFDRVAARWQLFGPVMMIAGPDLIGRVVNPGDILRYANGHIASTFVHTAADLERRLSSLDSEPGVDGRWRVEVFGCRGGVWQAAVAELMDRADVVLMDLRGWNGQRAGCAFELEQLSSRLRGVQVVLVVDEQALNQLGPDMLATREGPMQCVAAGRGDTLFETLLKAAQGERAA